MYKLSIAVMLATTAFSASPASDEERKHIIAFASTLITQDAVCPPTDKSRNAAALMIAAKAAGIDLTDKSVNAEILLGSAAMSQLANQMISQSHLSKRQWCQNVQTSLDKAREGDLYDIVSSRR
jgi:hypothetical protein